MAKANTADRCFAGVKDRDDAHWDFALQLDADDPDAFWNLLDARASWFYEAVSAAPSMAPKRPGKNWFAYVRLCEPTAAYFDRSWPLPDFEAL